MDDPGAGTGGRGNLTFLEIRYMLGICGREGLPANGPPSPAGGAACARAVCRSGCSGFWSGMSQRTMAQSDWIPLEALSAPQRRRVQSHLPLVYRTVRAMRLNPTRRSVASDRAELIQEGSLALIHAVRNHDPMRHGDFPPYAMARIHFAVSRYLHERSGPVRVPYVTQRRARKRGRAAAQEDGPSGPSGVLRTVRVDRWDLCRRQPHGPSFRATGDEGRDEAPDLGELIRARYERAAREVVRGMKSSPQSRPEMRPVVDLCVAHRWLVPEPAARLSLAEIARRLGCPLRKVARCEERFHRRMAARLGRDVMLAAVRRAARGSPDGLNHRPAPEDLARWEADAAMNSRRGRITARGRRVSGRPGRVSRLRPL